VESVTSPEGLSQIYILHGCYLTSYCLYKEIPEYFIEVLRLLVMDMTAGLTPSLERNLAFCLIQDSD